MIRIKFIMFVCNVHINAAFLLLIAVVLCATAKPLAQTVDTLAPTASVQKLTILPASPVKIGDTPFFAEIADLLNVTAAEQQQADESDDAAGAAGTDTNDLSVAETHIFRPLFVYRAVTVERRRHEELNL